MMTCVEYLSVVLHLRFSDVNIKPTGTAFFLKLGAALPLQCNTPEGLLHVTSFYYQTILWLWKQLLFCWLISTFKLSCGTGFKLQKVNIRLTWGFVPRDRKYWFLSWSWTLRGDFKRLCLILRHTLAYF